jgi:hypothetical protein
VGPVSPQVLHEYYETVTRKLKPGLTPEEARTDVRALFHWLVPIEAPLVLEAAWHFQAKGSFSFCSHPRRRPDHGLRLRPE